jgi:hypothetical protein
MTKGRVSGGDVGVSAAEESEGRDDDEDQGRDEGDDDYLRQTPAQQMRIFQLENSISSALRSDSTSSVCSFFRVLVFVTSEGIVSWLSVNPGLCCGRVVSKGINQMQ